MCYKGYMKIQIAVSSIFPGLCFSWHFTHASEQRRAGGEPFRVALRTARRNCRQAYSPAVVCGGRGCRERFRPEDTTPGGICFYFRRWLAYLPSTKIVSRSGSARSGSVRSGTASARHGGAEATARRLRGAPGSALLAAAVAFLTWQKGMASH